MLILGIVSGNAGVTWCGEKDAYVCSGSDDGSIQLWCVGSTDDKPHATLLEHDDTVARYPHDSSTTKQVLFLMLYLVYLVT